MFVIGFNVCMRVFPSECISERGVFNGTRDNCPLQVVVRFENHQHP